MPKNFEELGAKEEDIPKLVEVLCRGNGRNVSIFCVRLTEFSLNREKPAKLWM
jgi:hypothetical protein